jgi:hypothetical protein
MDEAGHLLAVDLRDILRALESEARTSAWRIREIEAIGPAADELRRLAEDGAPVSGERLLALSTGISQTIDGLFEAYRSGGESPWLRVRAVDASAFDVESIDDFVLHKVRRAFKVVNDMPD